jgi:hypothetical protein
VKRSRSTACSGAGGGGALRAKRLRSRAKRSSGVEGEAVEATTCSGGEAVKGALHRRRHAPGIGGVKACSVSGHGSVKDLKCASGKNLLSVERAART